MQNACLAFTLIFFVSWEKKSYLKIWQAHILPLCLDATCQSNLSLFCIKKTQNKQKWAFRDFSCFPCKGEPSSSSQSGCATSKYPQTKFNFRCLLRFHCRRNVTCINHYVNTASSSLGINASHNWDRKVVMGKIAVIYLADVEMRLWIK